MARRSGFEEPLVEVLGEATVEELPQKLKDLDAPGDAEQLVEILSEASNSASSLPEGLLARDNPFLDWLRKLGDGDGDGRTQRAPLKEPAESEEVAESTSPKAEQEADHSARLLLDPEALSRRLKERVLGQDQVVDRIVRRLAVTRAELDIRPERPDGAFLFVGPTGVGKTELARALADELFTDRESLIRLDMSEYAHDWGISRLTGPMPGYVGSDRPESWLTTRIRKQPESVLLLDEIEKAHPIVWNIFLQAFDAGRLTDSRGKIADFSRVVVIMTSNLGATAFSTNPLGFGDRTDDDRNREQRESQEVQGEVKSVLPPELFNRLDGVLDFRALDPADIEKIADLEVDRLIARLRDRGIELDVPPEVRRFIANHHYDRDYGARHLQRNLETLLVEPIALGGIASGEVTVSLDGETIALSHTG